MRIVRKRARRDETGAPEKKDLAFVGTTLDDLSGFPDAVKRTVGMALEVACRGGKHAKAKRWHGVGPGAFEVFENHNKGTYRAVYTVEFGDCIYVLHAFQKKSKSGIKTPQPDIDSIELRYKAAKQDYQAGLAEKGPRGSKRK